jgi:hypothetical protein
VHEQAGWVVIDGRRSRWYAASEMPEQETDGVVAKVHVGRVLLGFEEQPDRRSYLRAQPGRHGREPGSGRD